MRFAVSVSLQVLHTCIVNEIEQIEQGQTNASSRRATRAVVDLDAIRHNVRLLRAMAPRSGLMAVVKANAYGHGAVSVARACLDAGAVWLAVATVDEGVALRAARIDAPVLILAPSVPEEFPAVIAHGLTLAVGSLAMARSLAATARERGQRARVHVEVDTGLTRFGVPAPRAAAEIAAMAALDGLEVEGIYTHFVASEEPDKRPTQAQLAGFLDVIEALEARGVHIPIRHASNSGATLDLPQAHLSLVRPGIALYGYHPSGPEGDAGDLRPALSLVTRLVRVEEAPPGAGVSYNHTFHTRRRSVLGLVPLGYADGWSRLLSNRGHMLVRGRRCPIVGRVCMDQTVLDLTDVPGAAYGDPVVAIGRQGDEWISAEEIAGHVGTNSYQVLCSIGPRVPRDYVDGVCAVSPSPPRTR